MSTETYAPPGLAATDPFATDQVAIWDNWLPDPDAYRVWALEQVFDSVTIGSATFHGIALLSETLRDFMTALLAWKYPQLYTRLTMFRKSPLHQVEPSFVHHDRDMGTTSGILYLNPDPPAGDGTTFWRHKATGHVASAATEWEALQREWQDWRDTTLWEPWQTVEGKFNRLILFPSSMFHSRAIFENYGTGDESRLIQLLFMDGVL